MTKIICVAKVADRILRRLLFFDFLHKRPLIIDNPNSDFDSFQNRLQTLKEKTIKQ